MDLQRTLADLAEDHLAHMSAVGWDGFAKSLAEGRTGETFGCEVEGRYFDVGDRTAWASVEGGDILFTAFAETSGEQPVERTMMIHRIPR